MPVLRRALLVLLVASFAYQFADGINRSLQNNFFVEVLGLEPAQMGIWTSVRETPGFLMVFVAAVGMWLAPPYLGALSLFVNGIGYGGFALVTGFSGLLLTSVIGSTGFHLWMPIYNSLGLSIAHRGNAGRVMGQIQAAGYAGLFLSMGLMYLVINVVGYRPPFLLSGLMLGAGALAMLFFPHKAASWPKQRIVVRRRYWLYYLLNFMEGTRFQVFLAFGVYLLVREYSIDVRTITLLFVISSVINVIMSPLVGRWIDAVGERVSLTTSYTANLIVFLGLALIHHAGAAVVLYVAYNFLMLFVVAVNTYLKRIADPADLGPSLALGITAMHIPAMIVPLAGGFLWQRFGAQIPFLMGACFVLGSLIVTQFIPRRLVVEEKPRAQARASS